MQNTKKKLAQNLLNLDPIDKIASKKDLAFSVECFLSLTLSIL